MTKLRLAPGLTLPEDAVTQTFGILAKRGVGKTYTASVLAEEMLKAQLQVVVADPIGVWHGLRSSADGKRSGLPIYVFGGESKARDLPLELGAGELIADVVVDQRLSVVLDLSLFRKGEQVRFMTDFSERLYHRNREALHLFLDEADAFAPQKPPKGAERLLGAVEDLVRRGRARGLGVTLITQRSAVLNKDVLTQIEVLVTLRTISPQDRDAIDAWVKVHGTPKQREELMASLPALPVGTAWFWSPGWPTADGIFQRVQVRARETFDSSRTPKSGERRIQPKVLARVDLAALQEKMSATVERQKADDPKALRAQIRELQQQVKTASIRSAPVSPPKTERVEVPVLKNGTTKALTKAAAQMVRASELIAHSIGKLQDVSDTLKSASVPIALELLRIQTTPTGGAPVAGTIAAPPVRAVASRPVPDSTATTRGSRGERSNLPVGQPIHHAGGPVARTEGITGPQQRILDALAVLEQLGLSPASKVQLALFAHASPSSSAYANNLGALRSSAHIEYPRGGFVGLTDGGRAIANAAAAPSTVEDLHRFVERLVSGPQWRILRALIDAYPSAIAKEDLAAAAEASATSSAFANNLGALRSLGLIDYPAPGHVAALPVLFMEGRP